MGGLGRTRVVGRNGGIGECIAGILNRIVDAIEHSHWELIVGIGGKVVGVDAKEQVFH